MATADQIAEVRLATREPQNTEPYTDDFISSLIDDYGQREAEHKIWVAKRNAVATLVDVSEGGSSRKMSQVFDRYNTIVQGYETVDQSETSGRRAPRTRAIVRG